MSASYEEVLKRLIEERGRLGLSQNDMAQIVHITQSNYSKVENSRYRLSYAELKYLSESEIDIYYVFTGYKSAGKYIERFQQYTFAELCCFLGIIYSVVNLYASKHKSKQGDELTDRVKYVPLILEQRKSFNLFVAIRNSLGIRQIPMADKLGMDVKKLCDLEKGRCLPDMEIVWRLYDMFGISPAFVLKNKYCMLHEISALIESAEQNGVQLVDIIDLVSAEGRV